jgi:hypothetical protein
MHYDVLKTDSTDKIDKSKTITYVHTQYINAKEFHYNLNNYKW